MQITAYSIVLLTAAIVSGLLALYIWYRKPGYISSELSLLMIAITLWTLASAMESIVPDILSKITFSIVSYAGIVSIPVLFLLTASRYTQFDDWINKKSVLLLSIIPFSTFIIAITNNYHHLLWSNVFLNQGILGEHAVYERGVYFWINISYSYIIILFGILILARAIFRFPRFFSKQTRFLFAASVFPMIANITYVISPVLIDWIDITPISFVVSAILLSFAIFRYKLLEMIPIAREKIIDNLNDGIMILDSQNRIIEINSSARKMFEINYDEVGKPIDDILKYWPSIIKMINSKDDDIQKEIKINKAKKIFLELRVSLIYDRKNNIISRMLIFRDITERRVAEEKLKHMSFHDNLTGLYNRAFFEEEIKRLNKVRQLPLSVIVADVNGLKIINDAFGHQLGDELLMVSSRILRICCRAEDIIARWGGDEFIILLPKTPGKQAADVVKRIRNECEKINNFKIPLSIALGYSTKISESTDMKRVINEAEAKMYKNKMLESKITHQSFIESLLKTLQDNDIESEEHTDMVLEISTLLGKEFNLSDDKLDELRLTAKLHDIGIVAMDEGLLEKTGRLDDFEWEIIKRHSEIGYRIASSSTILASISEYILSHHEWFNGNGYPRGLKGLEIPLISRIISVADAFSVMKTGRIYKDKMDTREAVDELRRFGGIQFDPLVVEKLIEILERQGEVSTI
ncbi:MAG: histidine kinase N-terminal 7TM domain-containing protein [Actinomycetota bacterium]|nr:histidine kinase N-terminal 7TM domain-containing protein [Actinomycetota bacterium]